jgi:hypothetical protein
LDLTSLGLDGDKFGLELGMIIDFVLGEVDFLNSELEEMVESGVRG